MCDRKVTCPVQHLDVVQAGVRLNDLLSDVKYFCRDCQKFFYLDIRDGTNLFSEEIADSYQQFADHNLSPSEGFKKNSDGIIELIPTE